MAKEHFMYPVITNRPSSTAVQLKGPGVEGQRTVAPVPEGFNDAALLARFRLTAHHVAAYCVNRAGPSTTPCRHPASPHAQNARWITRPCNTLARPKCPNTGWGAIDGDGTNVDLAARSPDPPQLNVS